MPKKSYPYNELSKTKTCIDCGGFLKKRHEEEHPDWIRCYKCHKIKTDKQGGAHHVRRD